MKTTHFNSISPRLADGTFGKAQQGGPDPIVMKKAYRGKKRKRRPAGEGLGQLPPNLPASSGKTVPPIKVADKRGFSETKPRKKKKRQYQRGRVSLKQHENVGKEAAEAAKEATVLIRDSAIGETSKVAGRQLPRAAIGASARIQSKYVYPHVVRKFSEGKERSKVRDGLKTAGVLVGSGALWAAGDAGFRKIGARKRAAITESGDNAHARAQNRGLAKEMGKEPKPIATNAKTGRKIMPDMDPGTARSAAEKAKRKRIKAKGVRRKIYKAGRRLIRARFKFEEPTELSESGQTYKQRFKNRMRVAQSRKIRRNRNVGIARDAALGGTSVASGVVGTRALMGRRILPGAAGLVVSGAAGALALKKRGKSHARGKVRRRLRANMG